MRRLSMGSVVLVSVVATAGDASAQRCLEYGGAQSVGELGDKKLDEASGFVVSATQTDVIWAHNDSGAEPRLHALDLQGERLARFDVTGADAVDWEDIAIGPCVTAGTRDCLFIADTGNNDGDRDDQTIYRVAEPDVDDASEATAAVDAMRVVIPDGADVEALFVDERGALWLVAKRDDDAVLYSVGLFTGGSVTAEPVATRSDIRFVTGADATGDGARIVLRSSEVAWELYREPGVSVEAAFAGPALTIVLAAEEQGESIAFAPDGSGLYTTSEGEGATLSWYPCVRFEVAIVDEVTPIDDAEATVEVAETTPTEATEVTPIEAVEAIEGAELAPIAEADGTEIQVVSARSEGCATTPSAWLGMVALLWTRRKAASIKARR